MIPSHKNADIVTSNSSNEEQLTKLKNELAGFLEECILPIPITFFLQPEPANIEINPKLVLENVIFSEQFASTCDKKKFLTEFCVLSEKEILQISQDTLGQFDNIQYCNYKQYRLSASNFGIILKAIKRNSYPKSFWERLTNAYDLNKVNYSFLYFYWFTYYFLIVIFSFSLGASCNVGQAS